MNVLSADPKFKKSHSVFKKAANSKCVSKPARGLSRDLQQNSKEMIKNKE